MPANQTRAQQPAASGAQQGKAAPAPAPFRVGTTRTLSLDGYSNTTTLTTTATQIPDYTPSPNAWLRGAWYQVTGVTSANAATVAFQGDGPFNVLQTVQFADANEKPLLLMDGYALMLVNKFGGYQYNDDPRASAVYSATTGVGSGTGGSFTFVLYVPLEVVSRDALGSLENKSSSSTFVLSTTLNTIANVYSTAPTSAPAVTVKIIEDGWLQPKAADASGQPLSQQPPAAGSTQYWVRGTYNGLNGAQQQQISQGLGYPIRSLIFVNYDVSNGTRATGDTDWPDPTQILWKGTSVLNVPKLIWKDQMSRNYGLTSTAADSANGLENGVYALPFNADFGLQDGAELRNGYLQTSQGDLFQLIGSFNGNSKVFVMANYVAPANGQASSLRAGR